MVNDLEAPIARHHPEIDQMKAALRRAGARGGGDVRQRLGRVRTVPAAARRAAAVERLAGSGWQVLLTESLGRPSTTVAVAWRRCGPVAD